MYWLRRNQVGDVLGKRNLVVKRHLNLRVEGASEIQMDGDAHHLEPVWCQWELWSWNGERTSTDHLCRRRDPSGDVMSLAAGLRSRENWPWRWGNIDAQVNTKSEDHLENQNMFNEQEKTCTKTHKSSFHTWNNANTLRWGRKGRKKVARYSGRRNKKNTHVDAKYSFLGIHLLPHPRHPPDVLNEERDQTVSETRPQMHCLGFMDGVDHGHSNSMKVRNGNEPSVILWSLYTIPGPFLALMWRFPPLCVHALKHGGMLTQELGWIQFYSVQKPRLKKIWISNA